MEKINLAHPEYPEDQELRGKLGGFLRREGDLLSYLAEACHLDNKSNRENDSND